MKTFEELNREERLTLKQNYLCTHKDGYVGYGDLCDADRLVDDTTLEQEYGGMVFSEEDF